jgi:transcriptional regulator with XRE-family HTH domain
MSAREAFGPNLRRLRIQRGVSLEQIAAATKVSASLWAGLERNDLSRWPTGIYARSYVRDYAHAIGVDPEVTVDEFCRWFSQGDRRAAGSIREHAEIVGHTPEFRDEVPATVLEGDRRGSPSTPPVSRPTGALSAFSQMFGRLRRTLDRA